jgi:hypothetical protein
VTESDLHAIDVALNELDCYIGVIGNDSVEVEHEANIGRLRWASKKLHRLLEREGLQREYGKTP